MNTALLTEHSNRNSTYPAILMTVLAITGVLVIYHETVWSMVATWHRSDTYAHGFLILPFVVYMIWTKRQNLTGLNQQPSPIALIGLCFLGFFWFIAELASVQVIMQYAVVAMLPLIVAIIMGFRIMLAFVFPLAYLFFAVPFGDILIPPLINFTADFTVAALQMSGIPVYREGTFFSLPTGNWSVVEACSGLRYLIASVTLGTLYAYLTYQSTYKRLIFIMFSIIVPIIANGIRAYLIVMTGHLSDMQIAVGVDHLIYGWVFFGFVMLLLFWIGSIWREDQNNTIDQQTTDQQLTTENGNNATVKKTTLVTLSVLVVSIIWPVYAAILEKDFNSVPPELHFNFSDKNWHATHTPLTEWKPTYIGTPGQFEAHFNNQEGRKVSLFITYYHHQRQGHELINSGNFLVPEMDSPWRKIGVNQLTTTVGSHEMTVIQTQLDANFEKLLVWNWYVLGEDETINPYIAKALLAKKRLFSGNDFGAEVIVATSYEMQPDEAALLLHQFLEDMLPKISNSLDAIDG